MIDIKPIYEFLVWDNCLNNCQFCFQRKNPRLFDLAQQQKNLQSVIKYISSNDFKRGSHVLIVGGELFDDINRQYFLIDFFEHIAEKMLVGDIDLLYLNTNLIFNADIYEKNIIQVLNIFKKNNLCSRLKFTTSFDMQGRFKNEQSKSFFIDNLNRTTVFDKQLHVVVNMILTNGFCQNILANKFDIFDFMQQFNVDVNLIPYIVFNSELKASRQMVFSTLQHLNAINTPFMSNWLINIDLKQPRKMFYVLNDSLESCECEVSMCGHSKNFKMYSDKNTCFVCDIKEVLNANI